MIPFLFSKFHFFFVVDVMTNKPVYVTVLPCLSEMMFAKL